MHKFAFLLLFLIIVSSCFQVGAGTAIAQESADRPAAEKAETAEQTVWHISADQIDFDQNDEAYVAQGHVSITREGKTLTADRVRYNEKTREALAEGNVQLVSGKDTLAGNYLKLNLDTEIGSLTKGSLFLDQNHLYLKGDEIRKTGHDSYWVSHASLTSCDDPEPDWKITSTEIEVTLEGYGFAKHAALWAKQMPVLYTPFLVFPAKTKRQSGLLMPEIGMSERRGTEYFQPFFWAINDSNDATFFAHNMTGRGFKGGLEYRYALEDQSMGTLMADGFVDKKVDDDKTDSRGQWGYEDPNDKVIIRPNEDRYWLRAKADQDLPDDFKAKLDIDWVSDQDYLHEFRDGTNGFNNTQSYFLSNYGRDIDDYTDYTRLNRLNISRIWQQYTFNGDLRWYDDVVKRRQEETNDTLQQLPAITVNGLRQSLFGSDFMYDLTSSYTYFFTEDSKRGQRIDLYPRVYYPFFLFGGLSLEPSIGVRQTSWYSEHNQENPDDDETIYNRTLYDLKMVATTEFYRTYGFTLAGQDRLKHAITPEITYEYIPHVNQGDYPQQSKNDYPLFERRVDRIVKKNLITYGLTNTLTARKPRITKNEMDEQNEQNEQDNPPVFDYTTFFRFKLLQSFDININNDKENYDVKEDEARPFSDIKAELDITPGEYIRLDSETAWSPYDNEFTSYLGTITLWDAKGEKLAATYHYRRDSEKDTQDGIDSIVLSTELMLSQSWQLRAGYELNRYNKKEIESSLGLSYQSQCWAVDLNYVAEERNRSYYVMFHLTGLGSIGSKP